ncbi:hypothetical protein VTO73DRAFT_5442 [Trametes versicolor]
MSEYGSPSLTTHGRGIANRIVLFRTLPPAYSNQALQPTHLRVSFQLATPYSGVHCLFLPAYQTTHISAPFQPGNKTAAR